MSALTDRQTEIGVFFTLLAVMVGVALYATRWRRARDPYSLQEWGIGGRAFGNWVTWFLIGGTAYTAGAYISVPSLTWGRARSDSTRSRSRCSRPRWCT